MGPFRLLRRLWSDRSAVSAVEFTIILPFLLIVLFGSIEAGRMIFITIKVHHAAFTLADLVTRDRTITNDKLTDVFDAVAVLFEPFDFNANGRAIVTAVGAVSTTENTIRWQASGGGTLTATSQLDAGDPALPTNLSLTVGETLIVSEVFYRYTPMFTNTLGSQQLVRMVYMRSRLGGLDTISP